MFIYNITFLVENNNEAEFLTWMRNHALLTLINPESPARSPRLTKVAQVPGDPEFSEQACTFALQTEFSNLQDAGKWAEIYLQPLLGEYSQKFGAEHALSFSTILESIDL